MGEPVIGLGGHLNRRPIIQTAHPRSESNTVRFV
jgi:hypothetical protein